MSYPPLRRLVGVLGGAFVAVAAVGVIVDPAASGRSVGAVSAPLLSARRAPQVLRVAIGRQQLAAQVDTIVGDTSFAEARPQSCLLATIDGGTVFADGADRSVTPASTLKVLTAATALSVIAPGTTFVTEARATQAPASGILAGDLWLVGGGDPLLETADYTLTQGHTAGIATKLETLADDVVAAGVTRIEGSVVGDDRRYDDKRVVDTWKRGYLASGEVGPIGALSINDNFTVRNARNRRTAATDVPRDAASEFAGLLIERGVSISGRPRGAVGSDPAAASAAPHVVASVESAPIETIVQEVLVWSDNTAAEMLLKETGFRTAQEPGSTTNGVQAVRSYLKGRALGTYNAVDGSGLDRSDKVTCRVLAGVLAAAGRSSALAAALPVMGESGTLRRRLLGDEAQGRVRAKTGTLDGVSSLAGYADTADGGSAVFAFVGNNLASTATGVIIANRVVQALVRFPDAPSEPALGLDTKR